MSERSLMKNKLRNYQDQAAELKKQARVNCDQIGKAVNPLLNDFIDMDIAGAAAMMDELVTQQAELMNLDTKIDALKQELYG